jgi:hypothetical protein
MGSVSDSTEFGVALREFELVRIVSRSGRSFPAWIEVDPRRIDIDQPSNKS